MEHHATGTCLSQDGSKLSDKEREQLKFLIEIYRTLSSDIAHRVDLQHKLLNFHMVFLGITSAAVIRFHGEIGNTEKFLFLVTVPLFLMFFTWAHTHHDIMILTYAKYLRIHINPRIKEISGMMNILEFEDFLMRERKKPFAILSIVGGEYNLAIFTSFVAILFGLVQAYELVIGNGSFDIFEWQFSQKIFVVFLIEMLLLIATIWLRLRVAYMYMRIDRRD